MAPLALIVEVTHAVQCCRVRKDDKFLEVAINGGADVLISGDGDLLELNPFRGIPILSPQEFLSYEVES